MEEDLEIIQKIKKGDKNAFNGLMEKYYKPVLNVIYRFYGCEKEEAEDVAQEVFLRVLKGIDNFEGRSSFFTYLYKVAMNLCFTKRKLEKTVKISIDDPETSESLLIDNEGFVEREYERRELEITIKKAVQSLPIEQRSVVILARFQNLSYEEIAGALNISVQAVKSRLHRAMMSLKEKLAEVAKEL